MWTAENRKDYDRKGLRYPSDQTDAEWALVKPFIATGKYATAAWEHRLRAVLDGGLPVAAVAEGLSATLDRARLVRTLALRRRARPVAVCALLAGARTGRQGSQPHRGHCR